MVYIRAGVEIVGNLGIDIAKSQVIYTSSASIEENRRVYSRQLVL